MQFRMFNAASLHMPQELYLGATAKPHPFADPRLYNFWTSGRLPEAVWQYVSDGAGGVVGRVESTGRNSSIWELVNKYLVAGEQRINRLKPHAG